MAFTTISGAAYGADTAFIGTELVDTISIVGLAGSAYLEGDAAGDTVIVTNFKAIVSDYTLKGGQGNDSITIDVLSLTDSFIAGNQGNDSIAAISITASTLQGGQGNDLIDVDAATNSLVAGNIGTDTLIASAVQASSVWGGQGNDSIRVTGSLIGASIEGNLANDRIEVVATTFTSSTVTGGLGNDTIDGTGSAARAGLVLDGNEGNDFLTGGAGNDLLNGGDDADVLAGAEGTDTLNGGAGNDTINGGDAADTLIGGGGKNLFTGTAVQSNSGGIAFTSTSTIDVISDWSKADDILNYGGTAIPVGVPPVSPTATVTANKQADSFADAFALVDAPGDIKTGYELIAVGPAAGTSFTAVLFIDANGDGDAEGAVQLGVTGLYGSKEGAWGSIANANVAVA